MKRTAIVILGGLLSGCGGGSAPGAENAAVANATSPAAISTRDPMEEKIDALTDVQRRVTFFRAIYDADYTCRKIIKIDNLPRDDDRPVWRATCDDQGEYVISLQPGGTFNVSGVMQPKRRPFPKATAIPAIDKVGK